MTGLRDVRLRDRGSISVDGKVLFVLTHVQIASATIRPNIDWISVALSHEVKAAGS